MSPLRLLAALLSLTSLLGYANPTVAAEATGPNLELLRTIEIPANSATARLQYGRLVARNGVQEQDAFCVFELDTVAELTQRVVPERFQVTRVSRSVETFAGMPAGMFATVFWMDDEQPSQIYYKTTFKLRSAHQPTVRSLACMSNQMMPGTYLNMRHLTLAEIRAALGGYFRLDPTDF